MKKLIVVVFGSKRHGKDALSNFIAEELVGNGWGRSVRRTSFAEPLKMAGRYLIGIPADLPDEEKESRFFYGRTARSWWQFLGTDFGRVQVDRDIWVDRMADLIRRDVHDVVVISDGRFRNEALGLCERLPGVEVRNVLIHRASVPDPLDPHPSEREVAEMRREYYAGHAPGVFQYVVENDGSLDDLRSQAWYLAQGFAQVFEASPS